MSEPDERPTEEEAELLELLRSTIDARVRPPDSMVDMIMAGYDITNIDSRLAELVEDHPGEVVGVRAGPSRPRLITCRSEELAFEFELRSQAPEILGHLEPAMDGTLRLEQADQQQSVELGPMAVFEFTLGSLKPFRLHYQPATGDPVVTDWILP